MSQIAYSYKKNDLRFNISSKVYENLDIAILFKNYS